MCGIPLVQGCPQKKPPGRADSKPRHCVVFWDSDLVVVRHHHQSQRNRCAMKQVSTTKYLIIMQYPFMTVSWIMNASVYKLHFEVWLCTKQHGFGNGVNQDSPRYPKIRPGSLRESSRKPSRHHLCSQKRPLSTSSLEQTVITCQQRWRLTRQRRWDFVDMRIPGTMVCIFCLYIYICVCISIYIIQYVYLM